MKNIYEVLKQKESDLNQLRLDLSALYRTIPLIAEEGDPKPALPSTQPRTEFP